MVTKLTAANFEKEVVKSGSPVIIDFYADWCGPCRMMGPVFEELSRGYEGKLNFLKLSVEENPKVADAFGVQGIPCLIIVNRGVEVGRIVGLNPKELLKQKIDAVLGRI
ncbi:thioredoxin [Candidatus Woesearchaeota archaeon]|nr:thioredoxin [Candidatus Woesearchaeota archaeon]